jgi:hypothetical protein
MNKGLRGAIGRFKVAVVAPIGITHIVAGRTWSMMLFQCLDLRCRRLTFFMTAPATVLSMALGASETIRMNMFFVSEEHIGSRWFEVRRCVQCLLWLRNRRVHSSNDVVRGDHHLGIVEVGATRLG